VRTCFRFDIGLDTQSEETGCQWARHLFPSKGGIFLAKDDFNSGGFSIMGIVQKMASQGAVRQQKRVFDVISNNLTNVQTVGFKRDVPLFHPILSQARDRAQPILSEGVKTLFHQGSIQKTGNSLDLAIDGEGFFKVMTPEGVRYTRAGNFGLNKEKVLKNADGFPVLGGRGEIRTEGQTIVVEANGSIKVDGKEQDQIIPVTFPNLDLLKKEGHSLFRLEVPQNEIEARDSQVLQGALESSNVNLVGEMIDLMDSMRSYEACLKVIQSNDELNSKVVNELGKV
jgi:flagellar basal-body rod protein FlgF